MASRIDEFSTSMLTTLASPFGSSHATVLSFGNDASPHSENMDSSSSLSYSRNEYLRGDFAVIGSLIGEWWGEWMGEWTGERMGEWGGVEGLNGERVSVYFFCSIRLLTVESDMRLLSHAVRGEDGERWGRVAAREPRGENICLRGVSGEERVSGLRPGVVGGLGGVREGLVGDRLGEVFLLGDFDLDCFFGDLFLYFWGLEYFAVGDGFLPK
jgi:hypothetical protein